MSPFTRISSLVQKTLSRSDPRLSFSLNCPSYSSYFGEIDKEPPFFFKSSLLCGRVAMYVLDSGCLVTLNSGEMGGKVARRLNYLLCIWASVLICWTNSLCFASVDSSLVMQSSDAVKLNVLFWCSQWCLNAHGREEKHVVGCYGSGVLNRGAQPTSKGALRWAFKLH